MTLNFSDSALLAFRVTWQEERQAVGQSLSRAGMGQGTGHLQAGQLFQLSGIPECLLLVAEGTRSRRALSAGCFCLFDSLSKFPRGLMDEGPAHGQWVRAEVPSCMAGLHLLL